MSIADIPGKSSNSIDSTDYRTKNRKGLTLAANSAFGKLSDIQSFFSTSSAGNKHNRNKENSLIESNDISDGKIERKGERNTMTMKLDFYSVNFNNCRAHIK